MVRDKVGAINPMQLPNQAREILQCLTCGTGLIRDQDHFICEQGHTFSIKEGCVFFIDPHQDISSSIKTNKTNVRNPKYWTTWRQLNFAFYQKQLMHQKQNSIIVDLGTGHGQFHDLLQNFPNLYATDFFSYPDVNIVCDFTNPLPLRDNSVHIIIASNVFEHLSNPEEVLKECFRILRPGGQLIATVPFLLGIHQAPYDFFRFTQFILKKMLEDCGFQERWVETIGSPKQVYLQMQKHYYQRLFKEQPNRLHPSALFLKFHWFAQGCINRYLPTIHQSEEPEPMPLGYGFVGTK